MALLSWLLLAGLMVAGSPSPAGAANNPANLGIRLTQTFYAYVRAGEEVNIRFRKFADESVAGSPSSGGTARITVHRPGATDVVCSVGDNQPVGQMCQWLGQTAPADGIWQIDFQGLNGGVHADRFTWSIDVLDSASVEVPGRVYTELYRGRGENLSNVNLWYVTDTGYQYAVTYTNFMGIDSAFTGDAIGVAQAGTCVSAYQSVNLNGSDLEVPDRGTCGDPFKIFFEQPDPTMPATADLWNGSSDWLQPPPAEPQLTNFTFTPAAANTRAGQFAFDATDFTGQLQIEIDGNNDGDYDDAEDQALPAAVTGDGTVTVDWDGLARNGAPVSPLSAITARVSITRVGEIHFLNADVEQRGGGIQVLALNGPNAGTPLADVIYYDDSSLSTAGRCGRLPSPRDGTSGIPSTGGAHSWNNGGCESGGNGSIGSWGNNRGIDDWMYHPWEEFQTLTIQPTLNPSVAQTKSVMPGSPSFDAATGLWTIVYQITETASGTGQTTYDLDDTLLYGPSMNVVATSAAPVTAGLPAPSASWNGGTGAVPDTRVATDVPITAGDVHVYEITVQVALTGPPVVDDACAAGGDFFNRATLTVSTYTETDDACSEPTVPTVVLDKDEISTTYNPATLEYTLTYRVSATATGVGQAQYTTTDTLRFGSSVQINGLSVVADPGSPTPNPLWNGGAGSTPNTTIVTNATINGGQVHSWVVTVRVALTGPPTGNPATCTANEDFFNEATLSVVGDPNVQADDVCRPIASPSVTHEKRLLGATFDSATGQWTVDYAIDVVAAGQGTGFYNLTDELQFGATMTVLSTDVSPPAGVPDPTTWDGETDLELALQQAIAGGSTQTFLITVVATVTNPPAPGTCQANEDFSNTSTLTVGTETETDSACVEPEQPAIDHDKSADSVTFDAVTGEYVITYTLTVSATGTGSRTYDLEDTLDFPPNVDITSATVSGATGLPGGQTPRAAWDGESDTLLADDIGISSTAQAGTVHTYTVVVRARLIAPDPVPNHPATCGVGTDFVNRSTVVSGSNVLDDNACIERPKPVVIPTKTLREPVALNPVTGVYTLTYDLSATAAATPAGQTFYDLTDQFAFGQGITVIATRIQPTADASTKVTWNGQGNTLLVDDQLITSGETDTITVEVDVLITAAPNDPTRCNAGVDVHNDVTLAASGQNPQTVSACAEPPAVQHTKEIIDGPRAIPGEPGRYTITYRLTETEIVDGGLPAPYDLTDTLRYGPDVTVIGVDSVTTNPDPLAGLNAGWNGLTDTLLVDNGVLEPGATHTVTVTVIVESRQPDPPDSDGQECSGPAGSGLDEDLANTSTLSSNGQDLTADACRPIPHPLIDHTKTLTGITPNGDGTYTVGYSVVATNQGDGAGIYDLADTLRYGAGVQIVGTPTVAASAGVVLVGGWNGTTSTGLVDDQPIEPSGQHMYTITVVVRPDPATTVGAATDCTLDGGESGTGVRNESHLTAPGVDQVRDTCGPLPHFTIDKEITTQPVDVGSGEYEMTYTVTVANDGAGAGAYDLADHLTYGGDVTIVAAQVSNTGPGGIATNPGWDGVADTSVTNGVVLASGGVHTYEVTVRFTIAPGATGASNDCALDPGESGTGLLNTATVDNNGNTADDSACALVVPPPPPPPSGSTTPPPPPSPPASVTPPTQEIPGQLPRTGGNQTPLIAIAIALLLCGGIVVRGTRRPRRRRMAR